MRKTLRIIAVTAGITCAVSTAVLGCIYLEDALGYIKNAKNSISKKIKENVYPCDIEIEE